VPLRLVLQPSGLVLEVLRSDVVVGRHSQADVRLPLPDVSRRHCRLVFTEGAWQVTDLNSLNGVYVNDERVPSATLHHRDRLRLGGFTFEVDLQPGSRTVRLSEEELRVSEDVLRHLSDSLAHPSVDPALPNRRAS
jgi:pSer/pThr/pTyr-binding forkhead associated (FHA) protein